MSNGLTLNDGLVFLFATQQGKPEIGRKNELMATSQLVARGVFRNQQVSSGVFRNCQVAARHKTAFFSVATFFNYYYLNCSANLRFYRWKMWIKLLSTISTNQNAN